jgi:hypothetical protein
MAQLTALLVTPWGLGAAVWAAPVVTPWGTGSAIWSTGGPYTPPAAPPGGTPTAPSTGARITIAAASAYNLVHALDVRDLRDNAVLPVDRVSIATDRDSIFWTLRASGGAALFAKLSTGEQPPRVRVTVDGAVWEFVVESCTRSRAHPAAQVAIEGRSLACAAGAPYQGEQTWAVEGDTTAAQIAAAANLYTELEVQWELDDWPVPAGVFSFNGTPLAVVRRVAEGAGAVVQSQRASYGVTVRPRYALLPNEWASTAPELELPLAVVEAESFQLDDQPPYDGVVVAGQQQGVIGLVRLAGTTGAHQAPMVTDVLITDVIAARQRGQAILGRSGKQQIHSITLPVVVAGGVAVVPDPGWLVRVVDTPPWVGLVTAVQLNVELPTATLGLTLERHTQLVDGTAAAPPITNVLTFTGTIPNVQVAPGAAVNVPLAGYWVGGQAPRAYSLRSGTLPAWLALNSSTGQLVGTAPGAPETSAPLAVRATDSIDSTADSNEFTVAVVGQSVNYLAISSQFTGVDSQEEGITNDGLLGGEMTPAGAFLSSTVTFSSPTSLAIFGSGTQIFGGYFTGHNYGPTSDAWEFECRIYATSGNGSYRGELTVSFTGPQWVVNYEVAGGQIKFWMKTITTAESQTELYALNAWHKITFKRDSSSVRLLVNDVEIRAVASSGLANANFYEVGLYIVEGTGLVYIDEVSLKLKSLT